MIRILTVLAACFLMAMPVLAVQPDEILNDPVLEERARDLSKDLRCVVCQNENIDSSHAGMARDLRILVRERLVAGDSDEEVLDFVVARYGDYVLFNPPFKPSTYALWIGPFAVMALGLLGVVLMLTRRPKKIDAKALALSEEEESAVAAMLAEDGKEGPKG
ncbi:cytochrome c-type biogenesis protein CycL [Dinoroseobacter shibae DFL 12 = DSM 16493]|jgi:cytochrome c-type biogenesis protein CcmH|uniref:Cytochrome c-type biogenesis protein n=1 Tax=Dinoroseobacter shibae (strain DSM 16493 / NCIMB 14021 / DFL 12) TaxID=398580 RepID=A8LP77_DINSH|nr:cytochrome c-type biogenesis protein [Dinoroseobacter shibae]ABV95142.1 cytochrome c-type biogenesis protein CycL [Dinoroseobacter shibae DFL 12 = DSM 16493]URF46556.1 cytochrome c-type biogenesis protein CcmH [Dinoroseobacter shibae]URF50862.1 cytochrome c-type biogenesis protein CcmH [Dinoroseobacter shibae]